MDNNSAGAHWLAPNANHLGLDNPAIDPSRSQAELFAGKVQIHPDTDPNDPMFGKYGLKRPDGRSGAGPGVGGGDDEV
jgi:Ca2+-transporting ATPase